MAGLSGGDPGNLVFLDLLIVVSRSGEGLLRGQRLDLVERQPGQFGSGGNRYVILLQGPPQQTKEAAGKAAYAQLSGVSAVCTLGGLMAGGAGESDRPGRPVGAVVLRRQEAALPQPDQSGCVGDVEAALQVDDIGRLRDPRPDALLFHDPADAFGGHEELPGESVGEPLLGALGDARQEEPRLRAAVEESAGELVHDGEAPPPQGHPRVDQQ